MPLGGRKLTVDQALAIAHKAGFRTKALVTAVAIMSAESGRFTGAWNINATEEPDGTIKKSIDRGLMQINSGQTSLEMLESFKAFPNVKHAYKQSGQGTNWTPWSAYNSGKYEDFMEETEAAFKAGKWRDLLPTIRDELDEC